MDKLSERRLAENEVILRQLNTEIKEFVLQDAPNEAFAKQPLRFFCECSNFDCRERIPITAKEYDELHRGDKNFIIRPGHNTPEIENVVDDKDTYMVVEKHDLPPAPKDIDPKRFL